MGLFGEVVKQVLTEDKTTDYIKKLISNNTDEFFKQYLKTKVADLPENLQEHFKQAAEHSYNVCIEHDLNLTQLFRLEFLNFFDISHGKGPVKYTMGLARLAIGQIGMFYTNHDHSKISKLKAMALFITEHPDLVPEYDGNFNGLKYLQLEDQVYPILKEYNLKNREELSDFVENTNYEIVPIKNFEQASQYGEYTSWCVTHEKAHFNSYTNNGQKFYFCLKDGFENIPKRAGENAPLDEYGLSMISVQVNKDGEPEHITTRWNHEYNGENNPGLKTPKQVQEVVGVNFYETFKPWTEEELEELRANGDYEEDEEVRREDYEQQRWENGVHLWDGCDLLVGYDEDFNFTEGDTNYYIYNTDYDDYEPVSYEEVNPNPVYVNSQLEMAILEKNYGSGYVIAVNCPSGDRYRRSNIEVISDVDYYKIFQMNGIEGSDVLICFINNGKFGYVSSGDIGESDESYNYNLDQDINENAIFINREINQYITEYQVAVEVEHSDGKHSLFIVNPGQSEVTTIVKADFPKNAVMFKYDPERDLVIGTLSNYNLEGIASSDNEYEGGKILSIESKLDNEHYLVRVESEQGGDNYILNDLNIIRIGDNKKLVPFDFASWRYVEELGLLVLKICYGPGTLDFNSYLFDLKNGKVVSNKHTDFMYANGVLQAGDCEGNDVKNAVFYMVNPKNYMQEAGPYKKIISIGNGKAVVKTGDEFCYIFDCNQFAFIKKAKKYDTINCYLHDKENNTVKLVALQSVSDDLIYIYDTKTMQVIDEKPLMPGYHPTTEKNFLLVKHADNTYNIINLVSGNFEKVFAKDVPKIDYDYGNMFLMAKNGNFVYIFDFEHGVVLPTKDGIDISGAINFWLSESGGRVFFFVNGNDGGTYRIRYDLIFNEGNNVLFASVDSQNYRQLSDWDSISNAPKDVQIKANAVLFPQEKIQVVNSFNEMLNRMDKTRNGSILL